VRRSWLVPGMLLAMSGSSTALDEAKLVDLTYAFSEETIYWPTENPFHLDVLAQGPSGHGYFYAANKFCAPEHGGTHIDAPRHFSEPGLTVDAVPLGAGIGPAAVVDVRAQAARDRDYRVSVDDLLGWEKMHGRLPEGAIVLMRSGWGKYWPDKQRYLGTATFGDTKNLHFPGFSQQAAEWLVRERRIDAIGVDTASIDYGPSADFIVHQIILGANKPALENVANLDRLPESGATIIALPMKIAGGTGAPARIIALLP